MCGFYNLRGEFIVMCGYLRGGRWERVVCLLGFSLHAIAWTAILFRLRDETKLWWTLRGRCFMP